MSYLAKVAPTFKLDRQPHLVETRFAEIYFCGMIPKFSFLPAWNFAEMVESASYNFSRSCDSPVGLRVVFETIFKSMKPGLLGLGLDEITSARFLMVITRSKDFLTDLELGESSKTLSHSLRILSIS